MHKSISEGTAHLALKQMGYNNSRPHWGPHLSGKNRKLRLHFAQRIKD